ncbi:MAG: hypothetical protein PHQ11_08030 [Paludibacter sp.]|nr:hypothetical protein [Paludibacter sp.]MDD4198295.1 hypothetical protein [Paludibacter sp.]MDD4426941.1 hypothetical protein [Paludibacter sp.]
MKTKFYILLFFTVTSLVGFSQSTDYETEPEKFYFRYGPKFGLNLTADFNNPPENFGDDFASQLEGNYQLGGFIQMGKKLYFQPEFHYAVQKIQNGEEVDTFEKLKIPVHVGLKFFDIGLLSLHISGGAMYTHNINETFSFDLNKLEYQIGAGIDLFDFITTDLRYTLRQGKTLAEQISDFQENGGVINLTVGLKL